MNFPKTTFAFIFHFVRQQWFKFFIISFSCVLWAASDIILPYVLKRIINIVQNYHGVVDGIYHAVSGPFFLLMGFWIAAEFFLRLQGVLQIYAFPILRSSIRSTVFNYVKLHSHEYFSSHFAGNIAKKLGDLPNSAQTLVEICCFQFVTAGTGAIFILAMMWATNPVFAIILFIWLCIHLGITFFFLRKSEQLWETHSEAVSTLSGKIVDVFSNMLNVRLFARADYEARYLKTYQADEIKKAQHAMWQVEFMRMGLGTNGLALMFGMVFMLVYGWVHHWVTLGDFTQISMQTFWLLGWIWFVTFQLSVFVRENGTISNALNIVKKNHDLIDKPSAPALIVKQGEIRFDKVCFGYQPDHLIFDHLDVTIQSGEKVGLVGFSGSGKSTFVNLILRFYDLNSGQILIDGQNIADMAQDSVRDQVAMIPQDPALFHRTLMENIRYGRLDATDEEVIHASKLAHCHDFIEKLTEQYHALVGERGIKLSGGQRQRIAIARAILKNAPILILDEATSSLDSVTEKLIQESLHTLIQDRTTIVVAHRLSTLADMDRILVFDKGRIIEQGTKNSLLRAKGHFARLWNMQTDGFLPDAETEN